MPEPLAQELRLLAQEVHHLAMEIRAHREQLLSDARERWNAREDREIYEGLLARSARIVRRLTRLDSSTTNQPK